LRRSRLVLLTLGVASVPLIATSALASVTPKAAPPHAQAGPSASQLLAKTQSCTPASHGKYKTDEDAGSATVTICKSGSAFFWKADMDIDCDGITTDNCSPDTDPAYQDQTSFETSEGTSFQADKTHYFVIPLPSSKFSYENAGITPGSVAAIIFNNKVVYAVFADEGPKDIIGEASFATAQALGIDPDPANGGTDSGVTYIVFPGKVPNPVEKNATIDQVGANAATAFVNG
jgi:Fungal chitosanase of glycosyl hydrolase group 75